MKALLIASVLFLVCSNAWAAIGSSVVIQPDPNGNTGPLPPHMTQQWQGSLPPMPTGSTVYIPPGIGEMRTGGNLPPTPYWDIFGTTPLPPQPPSMQPVPQGLDPVDPTAPNL